MLPDSLPRIRAMGRSIFDPVWAITEHVDHSCEIMHVLRGQVRVKTPKYSVAGGEGDTLFTPAHMPHRDVFPLDSTFEVYLVQFEWPGEKALLERFSPVQLARCAPEVRQQIAGEFRLLYQDFLSHHQYAAQTTSLRLLQIIYLMCRGASPPARAPRAGRPVGKSRRGAIMSQARQIILNRYHEEITLDQMAESLGISSYYLSRVFSAESGFTLSSYLTTVRMERAAQLLKDPQRRVADAAAAVGFRDAHYFGKVFKAHYGESPGRYRAKVK